MTENVDYTSRWNALLAEACGGDPNKLSDMKREDGIAVNLEAFRRYLMECYCDQVKKELGPALTPKSDVEVLRLKAMHIHHWKYEDVKHLNGNGLLTVLCGELAHFKLPQEAYAPVRLRFEMNPRLNEAVDHHRPDEPNVR